MIDSLATIFGVCIALVAAVLGMAFPMFVERINGIVDKYGAPEISKKFKSEPSYKCFNVLMVVCIIELFVFPIIMMAVGTQFCNLLLICIQGICVFTLCMIIIRVFFLVMTYSGPHSFLNRIKTNDTDEKKLLSSLQILIEYSSRNDIYADIYNEAMKILRDKITDFQNERVNESQTNRQTQDRKYFEYPPHIYDVIEGLRKSSTKPGNTILNMQPDMVWSLYGFSNGFPITNSTYELMWLWINGMVEAKHDVWMKRYWAIATRCYTYSKFGLNEASAIDNSEKEAEKFREFHLMVGVLLFYQKRYDVLRYAFTFTDFLPPRYPLIPDTFLQIFDWCEKFLWSDAYFYTLKYNIIGDDEGAKTGFKINGLLPDYLALLMVRLFSVKDDYKITNSEPIELPAAGQTIEDNNDKIKRINAIISHLETIPRGALEALDLKTYWKQDAKKLLEDFIEECKKRNLLIKRFISEGRAEEIKQGLMDALTRENPFLPTSEERCKGEEDEIFLADLEEKITDELMIYDHSYQWFYLGESLIQRLLIQPIEFYCNKLVEIDAIKTYSIAYRDFGEALKGLKLTSKYAIVALSVSPNTMAEIKEFEMDANGITYQGNGKNSRVNVYSIPSYADSRVLIMREIDVPRFKYRDLEESEYDKNEYCEIESEKHLYSNIDNITETDFTLKAKQGFYVHIPKPLKYVCIRIQSSLESAATDVSNVEPIKNLIK